MKISGQKQDFWLFFILFRAPRLKNLGAHDGDIAMTKAPLGKNLQEKVDQIPDNKSKTSIILPCLGSLILLNKTLELIMNSQNI